MFKKITAIFRAFVPTKEQKQNDASSDFIKKGVFSSGRVMEFNRALYDQFYGKKKSEDE